MFQLKLVLIGKVCIYWAYQGFHFHNNNIEREGGGEEGREREKIREVGGGGGTSGNYEGKMPASSYVIVFPGTTKFSLTMLRQLSTYCVLKLIWTENKTKNF